MCEFHQLVRNDLGYVVHCSSCNIYQVCFLTTLVSLYPEEFFTLRKHITQKIADDYYYIDDGIRNIFVPTFTGSVHLLLTRSELLLLRDMLEDADTEEKALFLLRLLLM